MVKFSNSNSKINKLARYLGLHQNNVYSFDLPAGYTCPKANLCKSYANRKTGKVTDSKDMQFRCYATSLEAVFPSARNLHWNNFDTLRNSNNMVDTLNEALPVNAKIVRIHSSGDFFSKEYFNAWVIVASLHPEITFFGYTKILDYVNAEKPENFKLVYSYGGKMDSMITNQPVSYVVDTIQDGINKGLPVSCQENPVDDYDYIIAGKSFALALHGTQPAGRKNKLVLA